MPRFLPPNRPAPTPRRRLVAFACALLVATGAACDDPLRIQPGGETVLDTLTVYSLSGTRPEFPAALWRPGGGLGLEPTRIDGTFDFDVAFDLGEGGQVTLYPVGMIGGSFVSNRRVGIQTATGTYEAVERAPTNGYQFDTATVVTAGQTAIVQINDPIACQFSFSPFVYAKLVVDSVDVARRAIHVRTLLDPNCGFRDLKPGLPDD